MSYFKEESIVDGCISHGRISKKNLSYLEKEFQEGFDAVAEAVSINFADGNTCEEFDLPRGSYWIQVIASLLDLKTPLAEEISVIWKLKFFDP